jgi:phage terminase large subunit-like protein
VRKTQGEFSDKDTREAPFCAAQCEAGNVKVHTARMDGQFLDQLAIFPKGKDVDCLSGAFNELVEARKILLS